MTMHYFCNIICNLVNAITVTTGAERNLFRQDAGKDVIFVFLVRYSVDLNSDVFYKIKTFLFFKKHVFRHTHIHTYACAGG